MYILPKVAVFLALDENLKGKFQTQHSRPNNTSLLPASGAWALNLEILGILQEM